MLLYGPSDAAQAICSSFEPCSASSYGTFGIRLRATKSLTASIGGKVGTDRKPGRLSLYVELHCLEGALKRKAEKTHRRIF
jgi:hypothetical protein